MTHQDEIAKLAREYAEEYTRKTYPNAPGHVRERIIEGRLEHMEDFLPWLLRTHCIVSKEKVKGIYDEANQGDAYDRFDNGYNLGVVDILESLFDVETFKNSEE